MPRKDLYHDLVVEALQHEGWTITDDPLRLSVADTNVYVDLGAEQVLGAEREGLEIAVEIKSFLSPSAVHDLQQAVGQYNVYRDVLEELEPSRSLHLAIPRRAFEDVFQQRFGRLILEKQRLQLIIFDEAHERRLEWQPRPLTSYEP